MTTWSRPAFSEKNTRGIGNIARGPAMTRDQALCALLTGAETAETAVCGGAQVLSVGEMGIGNTATSAAVLSALTGPDPADPIGVLSY